MSKEIDERFAAAVNTLKWVQEKLEVAQLGLAGAQTKFDNAVINIAIAEHDLEEARDELVTEIIA